jgi:putative photosynthetic complex assembly protein 2
VLSYGLPVVITLLIWWFSTGAILFLNGLPSKTFRWSMAGATLVGACSLYGIWLSSGDTTPGGAYLAFFSALMIWGWNETGFLLGYVTGSRKTPYPEGATGPQRFLFATQSIIYHECLIFVSGIAIAVVSWGGANQFGLWTFLVLWIMRLSTKFNIFLGVPNITVEFLPRHLAYLKSFFTIKPMNLLFPISIAVSTVVTTLLVLKTMEYPADSHAGIGFTLLTTLMALAVIEHWFLVIPLPFGEMWAWGLKSRKNLASVISISPTRNTNENISASTDLTATPASNLSDSSPLLKGEPPKELPKMWSTSVSSAGINR